MKTECELTVEQVARIANCHRNTVLRYEKEGFISPARDNNNFRRYTRRDAKKLKERLEIRKPAVAGN